ncbi:MAG: HAD hydrolase-like protein [Christensenellales bacterium]
MAEVITSRYGVPAETAMFGDRMETDIKFGANNGFTSVLVLTALLPETRFRLTISLPT